MTSTDTITVDIIGETGMAVSKPAIFLFNYACHYSYIEAPASAKLVINNSITVGKYTDQYTLYFCYKDVSYPIPNTTGFPYIVSGVHPISIWVKFPVDPEIQYLGDIEIQVAPPAPPST